MNCTTTLVWLYQEGNRICFLKDYLTVLYERMNLFLVFIPDAGWERNPMMYNERAHKIVLQK